PQTVTIGAIYLGGDDPETQENEAWDPLFGRWPKWSESYIYTQLREDGVAYWSNLASLYGVLACSPAPGLDFSLSYHHLMASVRSTLTYPDSTVCGGETRGNLVIGKLGYRINDRLTGHFLWEGFVPGDYYRDDADGYSWLRAELLCQI
ncbi:MAG: hypothetical protein KKA42_02255, partial [candidate division Zixibacteria bacterium]|nr:hypothetical protein [candidate division Zixibacteria bacterium]